MFLCWQHSLATLAGSGRFTPQVSHFTVRITSQSFTCLLRIGKHHVYYSEHHLLLSGLHLQLSRIKECHVNLLFINDILPSISSDEIADPLTWFTCHLTSPQLRRLLNNLRIDTDNSNRNLKQVSRIGRCQRAVNHVIADHKN